MKKALTTVLMILLVWNVLLTIQVVKVKNQEPAVQETKIVRKASTDISSDLTDLVKKCEDKVVTVTTLVYEEQASSGSGAIYRADGKTAYIITNNHVIESGQKIMVSFANGSEKEAEVVGKDAISDLALMKVETDFQPEAFTLGDSSLTKKGEYVVAMGSPLGIEYQGSVSYGVISGVDRRIDIDVDQNGVADWDMLVLQTDAAINPGNSGGPLINMAGELIGINSLKISDEKVEGFGFAIPSNEVATIIAQLEKDGKVVRPIMGITAASVSDFTEYEKSRNHIDDKTTGIYVTSVVKGGPAHKAGMQAGDVITKFDGKELTSFKQFRKLLYEKKVGDKVKIEYIREGKKGETSVVLS